MNAKHLLTNRIEDSEPPSGGNYGLVAPMAEAAASAVREVVLGMWQAVSRRDWDAIKAFLSGDCLYVDMPVPALSARGPDDMVKMLKTFQPRLKPPAYCAWLTDDM